ncbi:unnamed protein product, partial [Staurois parvus]
SGRFGRPFFSVLWPFFFFSVKLEKNRPILPIGRFSRQLVGKSADFLPIKNLRMSSDLQEEDKKRKKMRMKKKKMRMKKRMRMKKKRMRMKKKRMRMKKKRRMRMKKKK